MTIDLTSSDLTRAWLFAVGHPTGTKYWSTQAITVDGQAYEAQVIPGDLSISISSRKSRIHRADDFRFSIPNPDNTTWTPSDFLGRAVTISLWADDASSGGTGVVRAFKFVVKSCENAYHELKFTLEDALTEAILEQLYPETLSIASIWPALHADQDGIVPVPFGTPYTRCPSAWIADSDSGGVEKRWFVLGEDGTYTIHKIAAPRELDMDIEWESSGFTFDQATFDGYRVFQALIRLIEPGGPPAVGRTETADADWELSGVDLTRVEASSNSLILEKRPALDFRQGYAELPSDMVSSLMDGSNDFTIEIKLTPREYNGSGWSVYTPYGERNIWLISWGNGIFVHFYDNSDIKFAVRTDALEAGGYMDDNREYHVSVVFTAGGDLELYIDGVLVDSTTAPATIKAATSRSYLGYPGAGESFCGEMRDFRIWNKALSVQEITDNMRADLTGSETNLVAHYPMNEDSGIAISDSTGTYEDAYFIKDDNDADNADFNTWSGGASSDPSNWTSWSADGSVAIAREETIKYNGNYSAKVTRNTSDCILYQIPSGIGAIANWQGKTVRFGVWVYATVANRAYIAVYDGVGATSSGFHSGGGSWELLTVEHTMNAAATAIRLDLTVYNGATSVYFDQVWFTEVIDAWEPDRYNPHGYRISPALDLGDVEKVKSSRIHWNANETSVSAVKVYAAVNTSDTVPPSIGDFVEQASAAAITEIAIAADLTGKCLWLMQVLTTDHVDYTPYLNSLYVAVYNDRESTDYEPGLFVRGGKVLPFPTKYSRSDTVSKTNPADIIADLVMAGTGITVDKTAAASALTTWGIALNGAFNQQRTREEILESLLMQSACCLIIDADGDRKIQTLTKTSQKTITSALIAEETWSYEPIILADVADGGYVAFCGPDEPQDLLYKYAIGLDASPPDNPADDIIEMPYLADSEAAQVLTILTLERRLNRTARISMDGSPDLLTLNPDDVLTISGSDYGASATYDVIMTGLTINEDLDVRLRADRVAQTLHDFADITPTLITLEDDTIANAWQPVTAGPDSTTGSAPNALTGKLLIGATDNRITLDPYDPAIVLYEAGEEVIRLGYLGSGMGYGLSVPAGALNIGGVIINSVADGADKTKTIIDGGLITTGYIQSHNYAADAGMLIDLWNAAITVNEAAGLTINSAGGITVDAEEGIKMLGASSIYMEEPDSVLCTNGRTSGGFVEFYATAHGFITGDRIRFHDENGTAADWNLLEASEVFIIERVDDDWFYIKDTAGIAIPTTGFGAWTGTMYAVEVLPSLISFASEKGATTPVEIYMGTAPGYWANGLHFWPSVDYGGRIVFGADPTQNIAENMKRIGGFYVASGNIWLNYLDTKSYGFNLRTTNSAGSERDGEAWFWKQLVRFTELTTEPVGAGSPGIYAYGGELRGIDAAGNKKDLTPHIFSLFTPPPEYEYPWVHHCTNDFLGKTIEADMFGAVRAVEKLWEQVFSEKKKLIHLADLPKLDWEADQKRQEVEYVKAKLSEDPTKTEADIEPFQKRPIPDWIKARLEYEKQQEKEIAEEDLDSSGFPEDPKDPAEPTTRD
jgi:hypothetical protein